MHSYNTSTWEGEAGRKGVQGHPWFPSEFEVSLGCTHSALKQALQTWRVSLDRNKCLLWWPQGFHELRDPYDKVSTLCPCLWNLKTRLGTWDPLSLLFFETRVLLYGPGWPGSRLLCVCVCVCIYVYDCVCVCVCLSLSVCVYFMSVYLCVCLCMSVCVCVSVWWSGDPEIEPRATYILDKHSLPLRYSKYLLFFSFYLLWNRVLPRCSGRPLTQ